jgi:predicted phage terminase large subunit-like protein
MAQANDKIIAAKRLLRVKQAREDLLAFTHLSMPHPEEPGNADRSRYEEHKVHRLIADALQKVERGEILRLIINVQPRVGKSELVSRRLPAWFIGRDPYRQVAVGSYADSLAQDFGREVREIMKTPMYQQVFPGVQLRKGSASMERLQTDAGGVINFVGVGTGLTGKGADLLVIDDPIKDDVEAKSKTTRDKVWNWFTRVAMTRLMGAARVVICMTRWHEDDLVGRLTNPKSDYYDPKLAAHWTVINIPAFAEEDDPVGREVGEVLWPARTSEEFLQNYQALDPDGFQALFMGRPSPPEGSFFRREHLRTYQAEELPDNLRIYAASDHAVSEQQRRDKTCMGCVGVDENDNIWVLPDLVWRQIDAETATEAMLEQMREHRPLFWWAEKGHISQSIGPFLRRRMAEEAVYINIVEQTPVRDKQTRAQSIQARCSMGKVFFPAFANWWPDARDELLAFPNSSHDDFVDFMAWIGKGLSLQVGPGVGKASKPKPMTGSIQWILQSSDRIRNKNPDQATPKRYLQ